MVGDSGPHLLLIGEDYHLGDLLWLTAVLSCYREARRPSLLILGLPDRPINHILDGNPAVDELVFGAGDAVLAGLRARYGDGLTVRDLRPLPIARAMLRDWRYYPPWRYYRDLWFQDRGQWLATFLKLGRLHDPRPILRLADADRKIARSLDAPYVLLAPHTGSYSIPLLGAAWQRVKGWPLERWAYLAHKLQREGYQPLTLGAEGQCPIPGTRGLIGLPIRQVAGIIERAAALVTVESGLWFIAAALDTPFIIVRWWLPRSIDWAAPMHVPYALVYREGDTVRDVLQMVNELIGYGPE